MGSNIVKLQDSCNEYIYLIKFIKDNVDYFENENNIIDLISTYTKLFGKHINQKLKYNDYLKWINFVHKTFPNDYNNMIVPNITEFTKACISQKNFCLKILPLIEKDYNYKIWKHEYCHYLYLWKFTTKTFNVIIPTLKEQFMWNAHMLKNTDYYLKISEQVYFHYNLLDKIGTMESKKDRKKFVKHMNQVIEKRKKENEEWLEMSASVPIFFG